MIQNIRWRIYAPLLGASLALVIEAAAALAQSGSAGGSIGNDEKSLSGSRSVEPDRPAAHSKPEPEDSRRSASRRGGGGGNFDGAWIVNSVGTPCGSGSQAIVVTSGKIIGEGIVSGHISPSGAASALGRYGSITVTSSGRFSGRGGSGTFKRSDGCVGRWVVSKQ